MPAEGARYRDDIQLIRAIAVAAVVLFHLGLTGFQAGFLGVDAFFVVSGYLMQRLYREDEGPVSFYRRRAKRLLPAYYAAVVATLIAAAFVTLPTEFRQVSKQAIFAAAFSSNFGFWLQNSYFSKSDFNPLLHLWSLGVELQFYLIFPFLWLATRRWKFLLPAIALGSLAACLLVVEISPKTSFFMMPLRIWQFAAGMAVAIYAPDIRRHSRIGLAAFVLLAVSFLLPYSGSGVGILDGHPGVVAMWATLLTSATLWFGLPAAVTASTPGRMGKMLGDYSYSIYLAHFPIIVLWNYKPFSGTILGDGGFQTMAWVLLLIVICSAILYRCFEITGSRLFTFGRAAALSAITACVAFSAPAAQLFGFPSADRIVFDAWLDRAPYRCGKLIRVTDPTAKTCDLSSGGKGSILLVGDSFSDSLKSSVVKVASRYDLGVRFVVSNAPLLEPAHDAHWLKEEQKDEDLRGILFHYSDRNLTEALVESMSSTRQNLPGMILLPAPVYASSVPEYLYEANHGVSDGITRIDDKSRQIELAKRNGVPFLDLSPNFCQTGKCALTAPDGKPYYFDGSHLTLTGATIAESVIDEALRFLVGGRSPSP